MNRFALALDLLAAGIRPATVTHMTGISEACAFCLQIAAEGEGGGAQTYFTRWPPLPAAARVTESVSP